MAENEKLRGGVFGNASRLPGVVRISVSKVEVKGSILCPNCGKQIRQEDIEKVKKNGCKRCNKPVPHL